MIRNSTASAASDEILVNAQGVSKKFCRDLRTSLWYGMQDIAAEILPGRNDEERHAVLRPGEFWAVDDVSFELRRGECLGLIGRNGAGKTTLLRMLNGLIKPDKGRIEVRGRVSALIALGAGFNPILSGRENIYVSAAVLGLSKRETDARIEEIIEFAELGEFIDAPVQSYSSGMSVRLGFAVSTTLEPDVLILDEVLAVGDAGFRHKCYHRINKLMARAAVIFVSHSMDYIAYISTRVGVMRRGRAEFYAEPASGVAAYACETTAANTVGDAGKIEHVYAPIRRAKVYLPTGTVNYRTPFQVTVIIECEADLPDVIFSFTATNMAEQAVMCWDSRRYLGTIGLRRGVQRLSFKFTPLLLHDGNYTWTFHATRRGSIEHLIWHVHAGQFSVVSPFGPIGDIPYLVDASDLMIAMIAPDDAEAEFSDAMHRSPAESTVGHK